MLIEGGIALTGGLITYLRLKNIDKTKMKNKWRETLLNCKVQGIRNKQEQTFTINKLYNTNYGYLGCCNIPKGLDFETLESAKGCLQDNLGCTLEIEKDIDKKNNVYVKVKFIFNIVNSKEFEPVKTMPWELFLGYKSDGTSYLLDTTLDPHVLIGGTTGTGKSSLLFSILGNMIYNNSKQTEVYLLQIAKAELNAFKDCKNIKFVANTLEESLYVLKRISKIMDERSQIFAEHGIRNIKLWNKLNKDKPMKYIYVVPEEFSFFMPSESEKEEIKELKLNCWTEILKITKLARSLGICLISVLQRSTATNLNTDVKALLSRITFRQKSVIDSNNIINTSDAVKLKRQEFIVDSNTDYVFLKSPIVDDENKILNKYVKEIKVAEAKQSIKNKPIIQSNIKYTSEKSETINITPEEYYEKTGYMTYGLKKNLGINKSKGTPENKIIDLVAPTEEDVIVKAPRRRGRKKKEVNNDVNA